jgi:hypothetical protein
LGWGPTCGSNIGWTAKNFAKNIFWELATLFRKLIFRKCVVGRQLGWCVTRIRNIGWSAENFAEKFCWELATLN